MHYRKDTRCFSASLQFTLADSEALRHQPCSHCHNIHSDAWQHIHYYSKTLMFRCAGGSSGALATWFGASLCHLDMVPCAPTVWAPCPATAVASGTLESFRTFVCMQRHTRDPGLFDEASCELASIIPPQKKNTLPVLAYASTWVAFTVAFQHDAAGSVPGDRRGKQRSRKNLTVQALPRRELEMEEIPFFFETSSRVLHVVWKHQLSWASHIDILGCRRGYGLRSRCPECRVEGGTSLTKDRRFLTPRKSASSFVWVAHSMSGALDRGMKSLQAVQRLSTCSGGAEVRQKGWGRGWQDHWTCDLQAH